MYGAQIKPLIESQRARKFKKVPTKKLVKSNKSRIFFDQNPFFAISKMAKNQFLNWKKFKTEYFP